MVSGASALAARFGISPLVIGLTIVAFGTSAPELFVNIFSAFKGQTELALGNVIGSNIANTWLVLGAAALVYPLHAKNSTIYKEVPFSLIASLALFFLAYDTFFSWGTVNLISRGESLVFLLFFILFFSYTFGLASNKSEDAEDISKQESMPVHISLLYILWGLLGLALWAEMLVGSAKNIALSFNVPESVIGLTIVAFGTSAPELVTSVIASLKKQSDIAIWNVVGSNIFNILLVLGSTGLVANLPLTSALVVDIFVELFAISLLIFCLLFIGKRWVITRGEGAVFLWLYFIYIGYLTYSQIF